MFIIKMMNTLDKVDRAIDDYNQKASKLNGLFDVVDQTTDMISSISDLAVGFITNGITNFIHKRERKEEKENEQEK